MEKIEDIRDIKPIFELSDYYFHIAAALIFLLLLAAGAIFAYRFLKKKKSDMRGEYIRRLKEIDLNDSKTAAYDMTKYLRLVALGTEEREMAEKIIQKLQAYKYAKDVPSLSDEVRSDYETFLEALNERHK